METNERPIMTEVTPLIPKASIEPTKNSFDENQYQNKLTSIHVDDTLTTARTTATSSATASYSGTIINIMKTCMGTGCLALPYACQQGGIVLYVVGLILIAVWNYIVMYLLIDCQQYIPSRSSIQQEQQRRTEQLRTEIEIDNDDINVSDASDIKNTKMEIQPQHPPGISTMGIMAWYSFGTFGLQILDCIIVILFLGIITAYVAAVITFLEDTPFTTGRRWCDAILTGGIMGTIAMVPDIGYLSRASGIGLIVLFTAFLVIAGYAIVGPVSEHTTIPEVVTSNTNLDGYAASTTSNDHRLQLWPMSIGSISHYYGIAVFGYGAVPLTYNFQESMQEPNRIVSATATALTLVAMSNIALGVGIYLLFPHLKSDVLHELPSSGLLPSTTRLAMVGTIIATAPLLIVPCSELLERRWVHILHSHVLRRAIVRYGLVSTCVIVAVSLPDFVEVLALAGCFCVALVSFCVPPTLHWRLLYLAYFRENQRNCGTVASIDRMSFPLKYAAFDATLLVWGVFATVVSTVCTLMK